MKTAHCRLGLCVVWFTAGCLRPKAVSTSEGPDWTSVTLESLSTPGTRQSIDQFSGRVVLLDFWAAWCRPCQMSLPYYRRLHQELAPSAQFSVVSVSLDEQAAEARGMMQALGLGFPVLWDPSGSVAGPAGVRSMPTAFVLDRRGRVRAREEGFFPGRVESPLRAVIDALLEEPDQPGPPVMVRGP